jgi:hypothetical protein
MPNQSTAIVQRLWNYCTVLRDDGFFYGDYVESRRAGLMPAPDTWKHDLTIGIGTLQSTQG